MFSFRSVKVKILTLSILSVSFVALALVLIVLTEKGGLKEDIEKELDELARNETSKIAKDVYLMARTTNELLNVQLENNLKVVTDKLDTLGVNFSRKMIEWDAKDQVSGRSDNIYLPEMFVGGQWLGKVDDANKTVPVLDEMVKIVGGTVTIFQRMNEKGDMLRVATNLLNKNGDRGIGTYVPASVDVVRKVLRGNTHKGVVHLFGEMYLTAYGPIFDPKSNSVIGMTVAALKQADFTSLRNGIMDIVVGKTGYVFVLGGKNKHHQGHYLVSAGGKSDGKNIWGVKDPVSDHLFIQEIVNKGVETKNGDAAFVQYQWKNPDDTDYRWKISAVTYFEPWDWVIGAGAYEDDFKAAKGRVDSSLNSMVSRGVIGAIILLILSSMLALLVSNRISKPLVQMVGVANALAEGDIDQEINVSSKDEVGDLAIAFQSMIESQKEMAQAAENVSKGNMDVNIQPRSERDTLSISLKNMLDVIKNMLAETDMLVNAVQSGDLKQRGKSKEFDGGWQDVIEGVNRLIDAFAAPVGVTLDYVKNISNGIIPEKITTEYKGDFNQLKDGINKLVDTIKWLVEDMNLLVDSALDGKLDTRADASRHLGDFKEIVNGINKTLDAILAPIQESSNVLEFLANRDLTVRVNGDYKGDHAKIKESVNQTADALGGALKQVSLASDQVAQVSSQIASSSQAVAEGANEQASSFQETSSSLEEIESMTRENAENAEQGNSMVSDMNDAADEGSRSMDEMIISMGQIKEAAEGTSDIIRDINEIAFQTNLLALNAAVEAARAGEAGRGFAVVAEEVRSLALRSKEAASKTEQLINQSVSLASKGEKVSTQVSKKLTEIVGSVVKVSKIVSEIAVASNEQARGIKQVNQAVAQMEQVTQRNAANSEESSSASEELSAQAQELSALVGRFKLEEGDVRTITQRSGNSSGRTALSQGSANASAKTSSPGTIYLSSDEIIPLDSDPDFKDF